MGITWSLDDNHMIEEISAMTGINKSAVKEVLEFQLISVIEKFSRDPSKATTVRIPLIGDLYIKYADDDEQADGSVKTNFNTFISLSQEMKTTLAKIIDNSPLETSTILDDIIQEKIDSTVFSTLET
jgi:hypothetical protein